LSPRDTLQGKATLRCAEALCRAKPYYHWFQFAPTVCGGRGFGAAFGYTFNVKQTLAFFRKRQESGLQRHSLSGIAVLARILLILYIQEHIATYSTHPPP